MGGQVERSWRGKGHNPIQTAVAKSCCGRREGEEEKCFRKAFSTRRMDDLNLHIIFFSVLLACTQSFIQMNKMVSEEEVKCEDAGSDKFSNYNWSLFENHITVPEVTKEIEPKFHLYRSGTMIGTRTRRRSMMRRRRRRESLLDVRKIQGRRPLKQQSKLQQPMSHRIQIMTSIEIIFKPTQKLIIMFTSEESLYQELT